MSEIINCPSGLSGRIRGMKVREERILADRKLAKNGGQVDELLGACWEETLDAGPYDFGDITASEHSEETGREPVISNQQLDKTPHAFASISKRLRQPAKTLPDPDVPIQTQNFGHKLGTPCSSGFCGF